MAMCGSLNQAQGEGGGMKNCRLGGPVWWRLLAFWWKLLLAAGNPQVLTPEQAWGRGSQVQPQASISIDCGALTPVRQI